MPSSVEKIVQLKPTCKSPVYISPLIVRNKETFDDYKAKQETKLVQDEFLNEDNLISPKKIFPSGIKKNIPENWALKIRANSSFKEYYFQLGVQNGLTKEETEYTINEGLHKLEGAIDWSQDNEHRGSVAARCSVATTIFGIAKSVFENVDSTPQFINTALNVIQGLSLGQRGYQQYSIYNRDDDDKGLAVYQREQYGNKITGDLAELSCAIETKFKPYVLPFLGLLSSDTRDCLNSLLTLPTTLFWRVRPGGLIHQKFATTLLKSIVHKPLAYLGFEGSKATLSQMEQDINLVTFGFMEERLKTLLGVKEGERIPNKIYSLARGLFSDDINVLEKSATVLNETFAPLLGMAGFFTSIIGIPLKAITTLSDGDNLPPFMKKSIDSFSTWGIATQQLLYSLRFSTAEYVQAKKIIEQLAKTKGGDKEQRKEFERLANNRYNLAMAGFAGNALSVLLPVTKFIDDSNLFLKITKSLVYETSNGLSQYFFSRRRELRGRKFRISNPKLFETPQPKPPEELPPTQLRIYRGD